MPDEDYSAYLKRQSYDDLVSISYTIDKEVHADRYQMILTEMAEREKRGEKTETKWQNSAAFVLGGWFILEFVLDLTWSRPAWRVVIDFVVGAGCLLTAWFNRKK